MLVTLSGRVMLARLVHFSNPPPSIRRTPSGITTSSSATQPLQNEPGISLTPSGIVRLFKLLQPLKVPSGKVMRVLGSETDFNLFNPLNEGHVVISSESTTVSSPAQPGELKAKRAFPFFFHRQ